MIVSPTVRRCSVALVILALLAFGASSGGMPAAVLGILFAILGWSITGGRNDWAAPKWSIATVLILVILRGVWTLTNRPATSIAPFLTFLASIMVVKCWERRTPRDIAQLLSIAAFVLIGSALGSNSFAIGLIIAAAFPLLVHAAMILQIDGARARVAHLQPNNTSPQATRGKPLLTSLTLSTLGVALAAGVFVVVPRTQGSSSLAALGLAGRRVSGFRDRVDLGSAGLINLSQSIVMEIDVVSGTGMPSVAGPEGELYLRGAVLDSYNHVDGTWSRSTRFAADDLSDALGIPQSFPFGLTHPGEQRDQVELVVHDRDRVGEQRPVFAPWRAISISHDAPESVALRADRTTGTAIFVDAIPRQYTILCTTDPGGSAEGIRQAATPVDSDIVTAFATRVLDEVHLSPVPDQRPISEDFRAVRALEQYLREHFTYTRNLLAAPQGVAPVDWFLDSAHEGHCEYFAGALAALCRSVGINARVVTGYVSGEFDPARRVYTVRQAGAHAWVEAEVGPGRWRTFDATPAEEISRLAGADQGVMLKLERWLASLETAWNSSVVNFGQGVSQRDIVNSKASRLLVEWSQRAEEFIKRIGVVPIVTWSLIGLGVASLTLAALGFSLKVVLRRTRRAKGTAGRAVRGEAAAIYHRTQRAWARLGSPKPPWRGALEHAQSLSGPSRPLSEHIASLCYESFFGNHPIPHDALQRAHRALQDLERLAREHGRT